LDNKRSRKRSKSKMLKVVRQGWLHDNKSRKRLKTIMEKLQSEVLSVREDDELEEEIREIPMEAITKKMKTRVITKKGKTREEEQVEIPIKTMMKTLMSTVKMTILEVTSLISYSAVS